MAKNSKFGKELRKREFDIDENIAFCNTAARACVPRILLEKQHDIVRERERDNHIWAMKRGPVLVWESTEALADFIGANVDNLTLVENATTGTNTVIKGQRYSPGDKILLSNHSYSAVINQAKITVQDNPGTELVFFDVPFPIRSKEDILTAFKGALERHKQIKLTVIDHIASPSCVLFPIKELTEMCHQYGVIVVIDGAHATGHIELSVEEYGADYYVGNLCKWLMVPQSAGYLWVHPKHQARLQPLLTSHGCFDPRFRTRFYPTLNRDLVSQVLVKDALKFYEDLGGLKAIISRNNKLVTSAAAMLSEALGIKQLEVSADCRAPMAVALYLPRKLEEAYSGLGRNELMYDLHMKGVSVRAIFKEGLALLRISCHVWNDWEDFEKVRDKLLELSEEVRGPLRKTPGYYFVPRPEMGKVVQNGSIENGSMGNGKVENGSIVNGFH